MADYPPTIRDTGHNVDGVREVVTQLQKQRHNRLHIVWGSVRDKDITGILALLPTEALYYFCEARIPRAMPAHELAEKAAGFGLQGLVIPDVNQALAAARSSAGGGDLIFIGGSTFVVAELDQL